MSARVAKLEELLGRVQRNRRPRPEHEGRTEPITAEVAVARPIAPSPEPEPPRAPTPAPLRLESERPRAIAPAPEPEAELEAPRPAPKPTPMEMALGGLETMEPSVDLEITVDEGPEISIDEEGELEEAIPTAPVETRAPVEARAPTPAPAQAPVEPAPPLEARPIALEAAAPSRPVARVVSHAHPSEPQSFGELLDRTLALRPR